MTLALAPASASIIFACTSRDHGQRPMLSMLCLSMAMIATLSEGVRDEALTPQSYAERSSPWINWDPPAKSNTSDTTRPRNQSFFQNPALVITSPDCSYCYFAGSMAPNRHRILRHPPLEVGPAKSQQSGPARPDRGNRMDQSGSEDFCPKTRKLLKIRNPRRHSDS